MKTLKYFLIIGMMLLWASPLYAQKTIGRRRGIEVVHVDRGEGAQPQTFYVNVWVDHSNHVYEDGDLMTVNVRSSKAGYLYLFYKDAEENVALLFPNRYHTDNYIEALKDIRIPDARMDFDLRTRSPFGKETLQAVVTLKPLEESAVTNFTNSSSVKMLTWKDLVKIENAAKAIVVEGHASTTPSGGSVGNDVAENAIEITTVPKGQVPRYEKKRVFVGICVAKYADNHIDDLPACEKDLEAMGRFFNSRPEVDSNHSLVFVNEDATKAKIHDLFFDYLRNETHPGDEIVIYWTGHGGRCSDTSGDEKDGYDETLILYDSDCDDPGTQLIDDDFGRWVQNLSGRKVLFIFDTCHSGGMGNQTKSLRKPIKSDWDFGFGECAQVKDLGQKNLALIASCAKDQLSLVRDEGDMSVMTWYILKNLKSNSRIDHRELYERIKEPVYEYVKRSSEFEQKVVIQDELDSAMPLNYTN